MIVFVGFLLFLGFGFDVFYIGEGELTFPIGSLAALGIGSASALTSYYSGDRAVLLSTGAMALDRALSSAAGPDDTYKIRQLDNVVEEMSIAAGLPKPRVYVIPDSDPNAFATGRDPEHASIAVTRGLLDKVTRDELQGVVAHELSHVRNLDIRLMTVIAAMVGTVALLSDWSSRGMSSGSRSSSHSRDNDKDSGAAGLFLLAVWVVAIVLAPLIAQALAMLVSRRREFLADATGAELTRNPLALASALEKIDREAAPTLSVKRGTAHLCIADPLGRAMGLREGFLPDLLATHPRMADRITALKQMAYQA